MTNQVAPIVTGQDLNVAARATRSVLDQVLGQAGISFPVHVTLLTVATGAGGAPSPSRRALRQALTAGLQIEEAAADQLLRQVTAAGLLRWTITAPETGDGDDGEDGDGAHAELTAEGRALQQRVARATAETAARLWRDFTPSELETTKRVLDQVTARAQAELAR